MNFTDYLKLMSCSGTFPISKTHATNDRLSSMSLSDGKTILNKITIEGKFFTNDFNNGVDVVFMDIPRIISFLNVVSKNKKLKDVELDMELIYGSVQNYSPFPKLLSIVKGHLSSKFLIAKSSVVKDISYPTFELDKGLELKSDDISEILSVGKIAKSEFVYITFDNGVVSFVFTDDINRKASDRIRVDIKYDVNISDATIKLNFKDFFSIFNTYKNGFHVNQYKDQVLVLNYSEENISSELLMSSSK